ncbi:hypothetical protein DFH11DRAFT_1881754 [Phellopilus nigrolimitatus]|nr:hypothetical protein DFH11DRAFT_1881754 [Phellopilus nigrolimitatus]
MSSVVHERHPQRRRMRTRCRKWEARRASAASAALLAPLDLEKRARENWLARRPVYWISQLYSECLDKACCFVDLKPYTVLEDAELSALDACFHTMSALCRSINMHKLRTHFLGAEELWAAQETERAIAYLRAYTAALRPGGALPEMEAARRRPRPFCRKKLVGLQGAQNDAIWLSMAASILEYAAQRDKNIHSSNYTLSVCTASPRLIALIAALPCAHFVLSRVAIFSLAAGDDFTLTQDSASEVFLIKRR